MEGNRGVIALITVLIVLAIALVISLSAGLLSVSESQMGLQKNQFSQSYYLANLCTEKALMELKENSSFPGEEINDIISNGSCTSTVSSGGSSWTVDVLADFYNQRKRIRTIVSQINPQMIIDSWQEVDEF